MILFKKSADLVSYTGAARKNGVKTGFVPTMGALHDGHISLISEARRQNELVVASIFVNPTQFNDPADFEKYPVTIEKDISLLEEAGCDILFLPSVAEIYPSGKDQQPHYELGRLETMMEGKYRPGHFQGVCMVVDRLLQIVRPDNLYLGQKDYQQCMVIKKLLELTAMDRKITINVSPTLREPDGLAMSSRNARLNAEEREQASGIFQALSTIKDQLKSGDLSKLTKRATESLITKGFNPDYVEIADADSLEPVRHWDGKQALVVLAAAFLNKVRLIDNILLNR